MYERIQSGNSPLQLKVMTALRKTPMAARAPSLSPKNNESKLASWLAGTVVVVVGALIIGGYWMQSKNAEQALQRQKAEIYQNYLQSTRVSSKTPEAAPVTRTEAQETRQYLLTHPAVTPGAAFDKPGVQATGKAIMQAIDRAKGL